MKRIIVFIVLTAMLMAGAGAGVVLADETEDDGTTVMNEVGDVRVTDVEWTDSSAHVTLEGTDDGMHRVTITDISPIDSEGAHSVDQETVRIRGDETVTAEVSLAKPGNPKLSLSSDGDAALLNGPDRAWNPFEGVTVTWAHVQTAGLSAALGGLLGVGLVGWSLVADRHDKHDLVKP